MIGKGVADMLMILLTHILLGVISMLYEMILLDVENTFATDLIITVVFCGIYILVGMWKYKTNVIGVSAIMVSSILTIPVLGELNMLPQMLRAVGGGGLAIAFTVVTGFGWENIEKFPFNIISVILILFGTAIFTSIGILIGRKRNKEKYIEYLETKKTRRAKKEAE